MAIQDSFLLDEVRCGFMVPSAIKQAWAAELEVLMEIDRVCRKHQIQYFADWGTLLGAVRHGGFVPWDDDLDIVMKREDYDKFLTVAKYDMEEGFAVQTYRNQKDFWLFMGKVVGKNHFCFEKEHLRRFHNFPYIACVDIFVLDYMYRDPEKEENRRTLCKYMLGVADAIVEERITPEKKERSLKTIEEMSGRKLERLKEPVEMGRYLYGEVEKIFAEVPREEADMLTQLFPWGLKGDAFGFPKEYYDQQVYLPFEEIFIPVPMLFDKMLRKRYGDYLRLVKDAGAHNYPFFEGQKKNLQKVLDFTLPVFHFEQEKIYRSEEERTCKMQSYKEMAKECSRELWRLKDEIMVAIDLAEQLCSEQLLDMLQVSQQLAVDLGTMLEQIIGEDSTIIHLLEQYCEELYHLYEQFLQGVEADTDTCDKLDQMQKAITTELEENIHGRKAVLFLPVFAKDWCGLHSLWQAASEDPSCDIYVVPLPYYYKDYDGSPKKVCCDVAEFPEEVHALDYQLLTVEYLEMLHPEKIIIQNPYDEWNPAFSVPERYYATNLRKFTDELIYVPPFVVEEYTKENYREYSNMQYYVTVPGVVYADKIIVQSENMRQLYVEKLIEFAGNDTREIWEQRIEALKLPSSKQIVESMGEYGNKKKLLYGISLGTYMEDPQTAYEKIKRNLQIFKCSEGQIEVAVYIFPDDSNVMLGLRNKIENLIQTQLDIQLLKSGQFRVRDYDAYYGDPMPIVTEFSQAKKPVMIQYIGSLISR